MKILYYECFSGISGDMNLAAMLGLGVDPSYLEAELKKLGLAGEFELHIQQDARKGIHGIRVNVVDTTCSHYSQSDQDDHEKHNHLPHRHLADIEKIIENSELTFPVKKTARAMFLAIAKAEAKIHGKDIYEVHFHEVGAVDSLVDIVGAAICYHALDVDEVWCSSIELGGGFVHCAHGVMPIPAPATLEILQNCPTKRGAVQKECTTPTGAAILKTLVTTFSDTPKFIIKKTAYGIGHRDTKIPNVVRVNLAEVEALENTDAIKEKCTVLECNIDDMTAESLGYAMDVMFKEGAMDVHFKAIMMKKNRPGTCLSVLCSHEYENKFIDLLFRHTTTLGVKSRNVEKTVLARIFEKCETPLGSVTIKKALYKGKTLRLKPEYDDCRKIAEERGIPLSEVFYAVYRSIEE